MKRYKLMFVCIYICTMVFSQSPAFIPLRDYKLNPTSPTASQFVRYDNCPVSEYTGMPNISIPLYSLDVDGVTIPLTLTYNAKGIKVNQDATWVGLGWDLSLGGVTQIVNDLDDFCTGDDVGATNALGNKKMLPDWLGTSTGSNYGYDYYPLPTDWERRYTATCIKLGSKPVASPVSANYNCWLSTDGYFSVNGERSQYESLFKGEYEAGVDSEPDIFKFNLLGELLNVVKDFQLGSFIVLNKQGYKISFDRKNESWEVTTPNKEKFYFVTNTKTFTVASSNVSYSNSCTARTWVLDRIVTKHGKEINFGYEKSIEQQESVIINHSQEKSIESHTVRHIPDFEAYCSVSNGNWMHDITVVSTSVSKEYLLTLNSITFPGGKLNFSTSTREDMPLACKLNNISVADMQGSIVKKIVFSYDYFMEEGTAAGKRLKLLSIKNDAEKYSFIYNPVPLPPKNSLGQDYWGYNNGAVQNKSLIPNPARFKEEYGTLDNGNNMSADLYYARSAILEKVIYPTGGGVSFNYELNQFTNYWVPDKDSLNNRISKGQGLRVKVINYWDIHGNIIKKNSYTYAGGKDMLQLSMMEVFTRLFHNNELEISSDILSISANGFYSSNPLNSMSGVGYDKVRKYDSDGSGGSLGYVESTYYNNVDNQPKQASDGLHVLSFIHLPTFKKTEYPENGKVKSRSYFDGNNKCKKSILFEYRNRLSPLKYGARVGNYSAYYVKPSQEFLFAVPPYYLSLFFVGLYPIIDFESLLISEKEISYYDSGNISLRKDYQYNGNGFLTNILKYNDDNSLLSKEMISYDTNSNPITLYRSGVDEFFEIRIYDTKDLLLEKRRVEKYAFPDLPIAKVTKYSLYNDQACLLQVKDHDDVTTTYLWSYHNMYPIAEIKNASYADVVSAIGDENFISHLALTIPTVEDFIRIDNLRILLPDAMITTYRYKPLIGISTITDPRGIITYYEYDSAGKLRYVKDQNKQILNYYEYNYNNK